MKLQIILVAISVLLHICGAFFFPGGPSPSTRMNYIKEVANKLSECQKKYSTPDSHGIVVEGELRRGLDDEISNWREDYATIMELLDSNYFNSQRYSQQKQIMTQAMIVDRNGYMLDSRCKMNTHDYRAKALEEFKQSAVPANVGAPKEDQGEGRPLSGGGY